MECPERLYIQLEDLERGDSADGDSSGVHHMLSENGKVIVVNLADNVALESQRRHVDAVESGQRAPRAEGRLPQRPQVVYVRGEWRLQHVDDHVAQRGSRGGAQTKQKHKE